MRSIQQIVTSTAHLANSAGAVANAMAKPRATSSTRSASSTNSATSAGTSTVTANDFLTLLVAEMKNQDPTQPTDPNAYVSQMVQVNSLQQLIGINQGVTSLDAATGATASSSPNTVKTDSSQ